MRYEIILHCIKGANKRKKWRFCFNDKTTVIIGRLPGCHLLLRDVRVSQSHCLLQIQETSLCVIDMGSTHGTYVNGKRIVDSAQALKNGDVIVVGNTSLQLEIIFRSAVTKKILPLPAERSSSTQEDVETKPDTSALAPTIIKQLYSKTTPKESVCYFCATRNSLILKIQNVSYCENCRHLAFFCTKELNAYQITGIAWHISAYGVILPVLKGPKKFLLYISKTPHAQISLKWWEEAEEVVHNSPPWLYPLLKFQEQDGYWTVLLPYLAGVFLHRLPKAFSQRRAIEIIINIAKSVEYGNQKWGIHGEISLENIYLEATGHPYLLGYGLVRATVLPNSPTPNQYSDMFSLALCLITLITGHSFAKHPRTSEVKAVLPRVSAPMLRHFLNAVLLNSQKYCYPTMTYFIDALALIKSAK